MPGAEEPAIEELVRLAVARRQPGARILCRLGGVSLVAERELRTATEKALALAFAGDGTSPAASDPNDPQSSFAILELEAACYPALAETPVALEFVERLRACAADDEIHDPEVMRTALQLGLDAFLESIS